jgi:tetratricopeptide (TPR) repeat protein
MFGGLYWVNTHIEQALEVLGSGKGQDVGRTVLFGLVALLFLGTWGRAEDTHAALRRAQDLENAGQSRESIPIYREVLHSDPKCLEAAVGLGRSLYTIGEYAQAASSFEKALELRAGDLETMNWLGRSYLQEKQPEKVLELLSHEGAGSGNAASIHLLLARAYDAQDKLNEANQEIQQALRLDPHCRGAHFAQGFIAWSTGDLAAAEQALREELDLDPHEILAAYYLAEVLEKLGRFTEAEAALTRTGRDAPDTYLFHLGLGKVHERKKEYAAAAEQYRRAIRMDPKQAEAHYRLALVLRGLGETAKANEQFHAFSQLQMHSEVGMAQGMGRMRPRLPDFDDQQAAGLRETQ